MTAPEPHKQPQSPQSRDFSEEAAQALDGDHLTLKDLRSVPLYVTADLGAASLTVRDVLEMKRGSVITLSKLAGEMTDIYVNGIPLARGEIVVIADNCHVRIAEVIGGPEKGDDLRDED